MCTMDDDKETSDKKQSSSSSSIPDLEHWPHGSVFLTARGNTQVPGHESGKALPLGVPFEFETPLFKGQMLVRIRSATSDDSEKCEAYFDGKKRLMSFAVQGQFKKSISMDEVYVGGLFEQPLRLAPPKFLKHLIRKFFDKISPGSILDFNSDKPRLLTIYAGSMQTMIVTPPGSEEPPPDITSINLTENTKAQFGEANFKSSKERKGKMSEPRKASKHTFDPENVYTFESYEEAVDYGTYMIKIPAYGDFNLSRCIGPQPMTISAVTKSTGEILYDFEVWHESVYKMRFPK